MLGAGVIEVANLIANCLTVVFLIALTVIVLRRYQFDRDHLEQSKQYMHLASGKGDEVIHKMDQVKEAIVAEKSTKMPGGRRHDDPSASGERPRLVLPDDDSGPLISSKETTKE